MINLEMVKEKLIASGHELVDEDNRDMSRLTGCRSGVRYYKKPEEETAIKSEWDAYEASRPVMRMADLRKIRNRLLAGSDHKILPDVSQDAEAWKKYRQELRDLPATAEADPMSFDLDRDFPAAPG